MKRQILPATLVLILCASGFTQTPAAAPTSVCVTNMQATQFTFKNIDVPGVQSTFAASISNRRQIVGTFADAAGVLHGYSDDVDGNSFRQIDFPGSTSTDVSNVNDRTEIVGEYTDVGGAAHGFLLRDGEFTTVDFPNAISSFASGINNAAVIDGSYQTADLSFHGFILGKNGFTTADDPAAEVVNADNGPFTVSEFLGLNDRHEFLGVFLDSNIDFHGFVFSGGTFQTIDVPGAMETIPFGLNDEGTIVGEYVDSQFSGHGYIQRGSKITTVDFPGASTTSLDQINSAGLIVGEYFDAAGFAHSFLIDSSVGDNGPDGAQGIGCPAQPQSAPLKQAAPQSCHATGPKGVVVCTGR